MEIRSCFWGKLRDTSLMSDSEATKGGPGMEHKMPKNILDNMFVGRREETEARSCKNWD
jgi:hypothetical protein